MCLSKLLAEKNLTKARRINRSGLHMAIVYEIKFPIINDTSSLEFNKHIFGKKCLLIFFLFCVNFKVTIPFHIFQ